MKNMKNKLKLGSVMQCNDTTRTDEDTTHRDEEMLKTWQCDAV